MSAAPEPDDPVFASMPLALIGYAVTLGVAYDELVSIAKIPPERLRDPDALVEYESLIRLWAALLERFEGRALGLEYARVLGPTTLGVLGYACRHRANLGEAMELYARYCRLTDPKLSITMERGPEVWRIAFDHEPRVEAMAEPMEMMLAATVLSARRMNPDATAPVDVCMRHPQRHSMSRYREVFGNAVSFEAEWTGLTLSISTLSLSIVGADLRVGRYLQQQVESIEQTRGLGRTEQPLEVRVREAIARAMAVSTPDQTTIARTLGLSVRSLQRGLKTSGTSFSEQLDVVRRTHALRLLRDPQRSIREIAFMIGYSDPRAFYRSVRRWTGHTPAQYRREMGSVCAGAPER